MIMTNLLAHSSTLHQLFEPQLCKLSDDNIVGFQTNLCTIPTELCINDLILHFNQSIYNYNYEWFNLVIDCKKTQQYPIENVDLIIQFASWISLNYKGQLQQIIFYLPSIEIHTKLYEMWDLLNEDLKLILFIKE